MPTAQFRLTMRPMILQLRHGAYTGRAFPFLAKGEFAQALPWLERALELCETKTVLLCLPTAYFATGWALARLNRSLEGISYLERSVTASESLGAKVDLSLFCLGWVEGSFLAGNIQDARRTADKALELALASGERGNEGGIRLPLAEISASEDSRELEPAASLYERAKTLAEELGMRPLIAHCPVGLGRLYRRAGKQQEGQEHLTIATTMYREMDMRFYMEQAAAK